MAAVPTATKPAKWGFERWKQDELGNPEFVPEAYLFVLDPKRDDPLTGQMVGFTQLSHIRDAGFWVINMTGILPEYRGEKLAQALKLRGMRVVAEQGGEIRTANDVPNKIMYDLNLKLGFRPYPDSLRYTKKLSE